MAFYNENEFNPVDEVTSDEDTATPVEETPTESAPADEVESGDTPMEEGTHSEDNTDEAQVA